VRVAASSSNGDGAPKRRVVVTGMGVVSPLGNEVRFYARCV
jgi:hypothetical protein